MPPKRMKKAGTTKKGLKNKGELVILTGLSGSGKLSALKTFEDLGYYAVDNLPLDLVPQATFGGINSPANPTIENRFPITGTETVLTYTGVVTKNAGRHLAKAGLLFEHWNQLKGINGNFTGTFDFSANNGAYTTALGNTGNPAALVPGFTPDLRKYENRITFAVLVKF